ncbi:CrcB family protein [Sporolactobacillus sp. THM7-4]|nr:CrcB family protein [Sporolactobacillus sp. THM7-4]
MGRRLEMKAIDILFAGLGGMAGALLRYLISMAGDQIWSFAFPLPTLLINLAGCYILGWLNGFVFKHVSSTVQAALGAGMIGAMTTFSTVSVDVVQLILNGHVWTGAADFLLSGTGGLLCAAAGYHSGCVREDRRQVRS